MFVKHGESWLYQDSESVHRLTNVNWKLDVRDGMMVSV